MAFCGGNVARSSSHASVPKIGVLMLDTMFPRYKGDIGHPDTFPFPVMRKTIKGATSKEVVLKGNKALIPFFIEAAKEMEDLGVQAITTSCGFLVRFQKAIASQLSVPFASSALLQSNLALSLLGNGRKVGILTARKSSLDEECLVACGIRAKDVAIEGMEGTAFYSMYVENNADADTAIMSQEILDAGNRLLKSEPEIGAIILECTNMPPFANKLRTSTGLPIFDCLTLVELLEKTL